MSQAQAKAESGAPAPRVVNWPTLGALLVCSLAAWLFLREAFAPGMTLAQADALFQFPPWAALAPAGFQASNPLLLDQSLVVLPWLDFAAQQLRQGELPLWNPYNYGGHPLAAAASGSFWFPVTWIFFLAGTWKALVWMALVRLSLAGWFTWLYLRACRVSGACALAGALAFEFCGFQWAWLGHPHSNAALCLPALLLLVERVAQRPTWRLGAVFAVAVGATLLSGHLQTALHVLLVTAIYALLRVFCAMEPPRPSLAGLRILGLGAGLGALLAAPQLLPFAEYLGLSQAQRVFATHDATSAVALADAARFAIDPDAFGAPHTHDYSGPLGDNLNYSELIGGYVGRAALVLALAALVLRRRERRIWLLGLLALSALLIAWQVPPFYELTRAFPVLGSTKLMRLLLISAFCCAVLAAFGLEALLERLRPGMRVPLALAAALLITCELFAAGRGYNPVVAIERIAPATPLTDALQTLTSDAQRGGRVLVASGEALKPNANLFARVPMVAGYDSLEYRTWNELVLLLAKTPPPLPFVSHIAAYDRLEALPLASLLGVRWIVADEALPAPLHPVQGGPPGLWENPQVLPHAFLATAVELVPDARQRLARLGAADFDPRVALLEAPLNASARLSTSATPPTLDEEQVRVVKARPRQLEIEAVLSTERLIVINDAFAPGWHAEAEFAEAPLELLRVDHGLRGLWLGPGSWHIRLSYAPASQTRGNLLALSASLAILALLFFGGRPCAARL